VEPDDVVMQPDNQYVPFIQPLTSYMSPGHGPYCHMQTPG